MAKVQRKLFDKYFECFRPGPSSRQRHTRSSRLTERYSILTGGGGDGGGVDEARSDGVEKEGCEGGAAVRG